MDLPERSNKPFSLRCRAFLGGWCRNRWAQHRSRDRTGASRCHSMEILKQRKTRNLNCIHRVAQGQNCCMHNCASTLFCSNRQQRNTWPAQAKKCSWFNLQFCYYWIIFTGIQLKGHQKKLVIRAAEQKTELQSWLAEVFLFKTL